MRNIKQATTDNLTHSQYTPHTESVYYVTVFATVI